MITPPLMPLLSQSWKKLLCVTLLLPSILLGASLLKQVKDGWSEADCDWSYEEPQKRLPVIPQKMAQGKKNLALLVAVEKGRLATVRSLLKQGANPNAANQEGMTALMTAALYEHRAIAKVLLDHGADTRLKDKAHTLSIFGHGRAYDVPIAGRTALQYAFEFNDGTAVMRLLIDRGADMNVRGTYDDTMLISAAGEGATEKARLLLSKGAALHLRDRWKRTALMQAHNNHYTDIIKLLQKAGAKE